MHLQWLSAQCLYLPFVSQHFFIFAGAFLKFLYIIDESFVCLCWGLTSQSTIFQSCRDGATASWVINQYFRGVKCLAQGHNTAVVGFEPPTSRSGVRHSTTEPPRSPHWRKNSNFGTRVSSSINVHAPHLQRHKGRTSFHLMNNNH